MVSQFRIFKEMDIFQRLCLIRLHHLLSHISLYQVRSQLLMIISLRYLCGDPPPTARWPEIGFVALLCPYLSIQMQMYWLGEGRCDRERGENRPFSI